MMFTVLIVVVLLGLGAWFRYAYGRHIPTTSEPLTGRVQREDCHKDGSHASISIKALAHLERGDTFYDHHQWEQAIAAYTEALQFNQRMPRHTITEDSLQDMNMILPYTPLYYQDISCFTALSYQLPQSLPDFSSQY